MITTSPRGTAAGPIYGAEAGNPEDALLIYDAKLGTDGPALLKYIEKGGLDAPDIKLVAEFRKEAEAAAKNGSFESRVSRWRYSGSDANSRSLVGLTPSSG